MSCTTGDRYGPRGIDTTYMPLDSVSGVGGMRMRCIKGTERYDRKKKGGGIAPFRLLNPMPVSKYGRLENFESNLRCFYNEIAPRTALLRCINNKIV